MENLFVPYVAAEIFQADSVLVFSPHPDDEVFGCGGAIIRHAMAGIPVEEIIISDGRYGLEPGGNPDEIAAIRRQESICASRLMGTSSPVFWEYGDREVPYNEEMVNRILAVLLDTGADLVYAPSFFEIHPDHRAVSLAAMEAIRRIGRGISLAMYEVGMPVRPNAFLDITGVCKLKEQAMQCFASQILVQDYHEQILGLNRYRSYTLGPEISVAEAYLMVESDQIRDNFFRLYDSDGKRRFYLPALPDAAQYPRVSVLVRSMGRKELAEALDSIALQTYPNIEIVVINALGPGHVPVDRQYGRFVLRFVDSDRPLSRSRAANSALENATGEFLVFLDDDDLFLPDHVSTLVTALSQNPDKKVAYSGIKCVDNAMKFTGTEFRHPFDAELLMAGNYIPVHAVMFSRDMLKVGCIIDEGLDLYEDWDFWIQMAQHTDFTFIDKVTALYRTGGGSGSGINPDKQAMYRAGEAIFNKWRSKWDVEKLNHLMSSIGNEELNQGLLHRAVDVLSGETDVQSGIGCRMAFVVHVFYPDIWQEIAGLLGEIGHDFDLFVTCPVGDREKISVMVMRDFPHAVLRTVENRGRDILPFLSIMPDVMQKDYVCICKLHTKQSGYEHTDGAMWRRDILSKLIGDDGTVREILSRFSTNPRLGIVGPEGHLLSCEEYLDSSQDTVMSLVGRMLPFLSCGDWNFFAGSMFWFRPAAMVPLIKIGLTPQDFEREAGQKEGTMAHAVERLFTLSALAAGFEVTETGDCQGGEVQRNSYPYARPASYYLMDEVKTLRQQLEHVEKALQEATSLAAERLCKMHEQEDSIKALEDALSHASGLAMERLEMLRQQESALSHASELAMQRLELMKQQEDALARASELAIQRLELTRQLEDALAAASELAEERGETVHSLEVRLEHVRSSTCFRFCRKMRLVPEL